MAGWWQPVLCFSERNLQFSFLSDKCHHSFRYDSCHEGLENIWVRESRAKPPFQRAKATQFKPSVLHSRLTARHTAYTACHWSQQPRRPRQSLCFEIPGILRLYSKLNFSPAVSSPAPVLSEYFIDAQDRVLNCRKPGFCSSISLICNLSVFSLNN